MGLINLKALSVEEKLQNNELTTEFEDHLFDMGIRRNEIGNFSEPKGYEGILLEEGIDFLKEKGIK